MSERSNEEGDGSSAESPDHDRTSAATPFRDPSDWKTGDEPITAAQRSYLETLATEAGETVEDIDSLTKAQAALRIDELQAKTGRGSARRS